MQDCSAAEHLHSTEDGLRYSHAAFGFGLRQATLGDSDAVVADADDHLVRQIFEQYVCLRRGPGVNQSVVSRAFNAGSGVAPETRERLLAIAKQLGYAPNALARGLLTGRTRLVGITTVQINSDIASDLLQKLGRGLLAANLHPLLLPLREAGSLADEIPRLFRFDVDALILVSASVTAALVETCTAWGRPVILLNRVAPGGGLHSVRTDDAAGGREAARHVVGRGARKPAFVSGPVEATTSAARQHGFMAGFAEAGRPAPRVVAGDFTYDSGLVAGRALLARRSGIDAVFCANDMMALGVMDAARALGLGIPDALQVIGFDDIPAAGFRSYQLTTFRHDLDAVAAETVSLLDRLDGDGAVPDTIDRALPATLVVRGSTRSLRQD